MLRNRCFDDVGFYENGFQFHQNFKNFTMVFRRYKTFDCEIWDIIAEVETKELGAPESMLENLPEYLKYEKKVTP